MVNWFIIQSLESYSQHPDWIGCELKENSNEPIHKQFKTIKKGDRVVYYATGDKVVVGVFLVVSNRMEVIHGDKYWLDPVGIFRLKPESMPPDGRYLDFKRLLFTDKITFQLFPDKDRWRYVVWNHYIYQLSASDLALIRRALTDSQFLTKVDFQESEVKVLANRLGAPVESASLLFEPIDEMGVVYLFAGYHKRLGFPFVVRLRSKFPDAYVIDSNGDQKTIELQFKASDFERDGHPLDGCDYIICWENDWEDAPKGSPKIIPLREALSDIFTLRR